LKRVELGQRGGHPGDTPVPHGGGHLSRRYGRYGVRIVPCPEEHLLLLGHLGHLDTRGGCNAARGVERVHLGEVGCGARGCGEGEDRCRVLIGVAGAVGRGGVGGPAEGVIVQAVEGQLVEAASLAKRELKNG
jgi:hypothetical protein